MARVGLAAVPVAIFLVTWHMLVDGSRRREFLFGSPRAIFSEAIRSLGDESYFRDLWTTTGEATLGLIIGVAAGSFLGILLFLNREVFRASRPYATAGAAVPIFTLAPMLILWFGAGFLARAMMSAGAVVFFALAEMWNELAAAEREHAEWLDGLGVERAKSLRHVYLVHARKSIVTIASKAVPLVMVGTFIAEFVVSEQGLGRRVLSASGVYDMPKVLFGVFSYMVLTVLFQHALHSANRLTRRLARKQVAG